MLFLIQSPQPPLEGGIAPFLGKSETDEVTWSSSDRQMTGIRLGGLSSGYRTMCAQGSHGWQEQLRVGRQSWVSLKLNFIPRAAKIPSSSLENQTEEQNPKNVTLNAKEKLGGSCGVSLIPFLNSFCSFISNQQL